MKYQWVRPQSELRSQRRFAIVEAFDFMGTTVAACVCESSEDCVGGCRKTVHQTNDLMLQRLSRVRDRMQAHRVPAVLILDPINIFYASGARNMMIFSMRTPARYLLLFAEGPAFLFDYTGCEHLSRDLPTIDQVLPARGLCHVSSGGDVEAAGIAMAREITGLYSDHVGRSGDLAVDRFPLASVRALEQQGFVLRDADPLFAEARAVKLPLEVEVMSEALRRVERAVANLEAKLEPGRSELALWADFHAPFIESEGQYVTTRLMQSGPRTYPYFQECGSRQIEANDLVCLDTDALGYQGYAVDFSRSFLSGSGRPTPRQRELYQRAKDQLDWNVSLMRGGVEYREIAAHAWQVPPEHQASRYYCIAHGLGMSGEFPNIPPAQRCVEYPLEGALLPGMVMCVESYVGCERSGQGVKLEEQVLISEQGNTVMSAYPFDERLSSRES